MGVRLWVVQGFLELSLGMRRQKGLVKIRASVYINLF